MGDRANIHLIEVEGGDLYFYTHWRGTELPQILAAALDRGRGRWSDDPYLARIIFSEMIQNEVLSETSYGISTQRGDYNWDDLVVHVADRTVTDRDGERLSFEAFIAKHKPAVRLAE